MKASTKQIKKLAQVFLRDKGHYSGEIDGVWGDLSNAGYTGYMRHLAGIGFEIGDEDRLPEEPEMLPATGIVVIDAGHGGDEKIGGSSPNNATSASGVLEKTITLDMAKLIRKSLADISGQSPGPGIEVHLTRSSDKNRGLKDRAQVAEAKNADVFVSIHFNGFNGIARGTETWILPKSKGNVNEAEDRALALRVQAGMLAAIRKFDPDARDRGIKDSQGLAVLRDVYLGNTRSSHPTRACLVEIEFIDVPSVDELLVTGPNAKNVRAEIANEIAHAIAEDLRSNS